MVIGLPAAYAQVQISNPTNYSVGSSPGQVVVADFNGDGKLDLAVLNTGDQTISILLGNGDGTFQPATSQPAGGAVTFLAAGDFNGDGKLDLAVAYGSANTVSVLLGNGDGTFQSTVPSDIGFSADFVAIADFNNDKKMDLLVSTGNGDTSNPTPGSIAILLGNGDGTFQTSKTSVTAILYTAYVAIGDFNGDGNLDVAAGEGVGLDCILKGAACLNGNVLVFLGNGDGTLQAPVKSPVNFAPTYFLARDFNGDGKADLAMGGLQVFDSGPELPFAQMRVITTVLGNGDGTFGAPIGVASLPGSVPLCRGPAVNGDILAADLNGDAQLDLMTTVTEFIGACGSPNPSSAIWAFLGNGDGTFQSAQQFNLAIQPGWLATGNFNSDTLPGFVVSNPSANSVSVFLNTTPSVTLSLTFAGNGGGTVATQSGVLNCSSSCSQAFAPGTTLTLTATPNAISEFNGWSGACPGMAATCALTLSADQSVTATFAAAPLSALSVSLAGNDGGSVTSTPAGINCGNVCSSSFITGTKIALTATPNATSNFTGWSGACSGAGSCNVTLNATASVNATFTAQDFSMAPASTSLSLQSGTPQTDIIAVAGINGPFASKIQLTCVVSGPTPQPSCGLSQVSVTPGASSATSTLTITAPVSAAMQLPFNHLQPGKFLFSFWLLLALLAVTFHSTGRKDVRPQWALSCFFVITVMMLVACGGTSQAPSIYTVTVAGTSGAIQHSTQITVTIP
jgi:hypothetical protein